MTKAVELREALLRVRAEASSARAFFFTWNALNMAQGDKQYLRTMNDYRNVDFFLVSMEGNFRLFFLSLGNMFDKRKGSVSLHLLHRRLHEANRLELERELDKVLKRHAPTIASIRKIRNKSIAHMDKDSMEAVLRSAAITPNQIETVIYEVCDVLNRISDAFDFPNRISKGDRFENAVQFLLDTLRRGRLSQDERD